MLCSISTIIVHIWAMARRFFGKYGVDSNAADSVSYEPMTKSIQHRAIAGAILTGGKSSRMGSRKSGILFCNELTMLDLAYNLLDELGLNKIAVGSLDEHESQRHRDVIIVPDLIPGRGPVGGLHSLFESGNAEEYLVLPCDMPLLSTDLLLRLVQSAGDDQTVVFRLGERLLPLPGLYPSSAIGVVREILQSPSASLMRLLQATQARTICLNEDDKALLTGVNTPDELAEAQRRFACLRK